MRIPFGCVALAVCASGCGGCEIDLRSDYPYDENDGVYRQPEFFPDASVPLRTGMIQAASPSPKPISGGTLAFDADHDLVAVGDSDRDVVHIVDYERYALVHIVRLQPGDDPGRAVFDDDGRLHVVLRGRGAIATIDPMVGAIVEVRPVCAAPRGIDRRNDRLLVACVGGALHDLPSTGTASTSVTHVADDLRDVVAADDRVWLSVFRAARVIELRDDGTRIEHDLPTLERSSGSYEAGVAWRMIAAPSGVFVLHQYHAQSPLSVARPGGYYGAASSDPISPVIAAAVTRIDRDGTVGVSAPLVGAVLPVDMTYRSFSSTLIVAGPGRPSDSVFETPLYFTSPDDCGRTDVATSVRTTSALDDVVSVGVTPRQVRVQFSRVTGTLLIGGRAVKPGGVDVRHTGHEIFHRDFGAGVACASCHPEGRDDGKIWTFAPGGPRRTQSSRGIAGTQPFHWDGSLSDMRHLVDEVMTSRMSTGVVGDRQLEHLEAWLNELEPIQVSRFDDPASVDRGKRVFEAAACDGCHGGAAFTNNTTVDVGTGGLFQVPSLRGLASRAPYMHDGCATTLSDWFGPCGGGDEHGQTSNLSEDELADLVAYLQSL